MSAPLDALRGESPRVVAIRRQVMQLLSRQAGASRLPPVLILGETGTGKGLLARAIHQAGPRRDGPFIAVNCAAIPETLLEAELFGYERGAFTDARRSKPGLFQTAHGGTLFLDELGLLPGTIQGKLLGAIEDRAVRRLGSTRSEAVDVAVLAATSVDLKQALSEGRFREDLYHRVAIITLELPPLRERGADILALAEHFLTRACADYGLSPRVLPQGAAELLAGYRWPGNVRELANAMERAALLSEGEQITTAALGLPASEARDDTAATSAVAPASSLDDTLRARIEAALRETGGSIRRTAAVLGISRNTLRARMDKYGLRQSAAELAPAPSSVRPPSARIQRMAPAQWERRHLAFLRARLLPSSTVDIALALDLIGEKVRGFGGTIEDAGPMEIVAVFGLEPVDNAPSLAALAALAIQNAATRAEDTPDARVDVVIGIHCDDHVIAQRDGMLQIGIDGKTATWSLLESLVAGETCSAIRVSDVVAPFLSRRFVVERLPIHGRMALTSLRGEDSAASNVTRFVGRRAELDEIDRALERTAAGRGQVVAIVGEPGVGKSRLVREAARSGRTKGWLILHAGAVPYGKTTPYLPVIDLLKAYFKIQDQDDSRSVGEKVTSRLIALDRALEPSVPPILTLLDAPVHDGQWQALDPPQRRQRILNSVRDVLLRESEDQRLLVVLEDLHWVDAETQALVDRLVESISGAPLTLLVNYRPEYQHAWDLKGCYRQLRLEPLSPESAEDLLRQLVGDEPGLASLERFLIERTGGNPFFIEECVRTMVETGTLTGERGAYRLGAVTPNLEIPATVRAVLAARIDRLDGADKRLLQAAAVIGQDVPQALLEAIGDQPADEMRGRLGRLETAGFLDVSRPVPDLQFTFKHALTHEVAYESLLLGKRRALHASVCEAITRVHGERLDDHVERLAHHALRGELWDQAVTWCRRAGARAASRSAYVPGAAHLEQALEALGHLAVTRTTTEQAVDIRLELRELLVPLGEQRRNLHRLEEALPLAETLGDPRRLGLVYRSLATAHWLLGDAGVGLGYGEKALVVGEEINDPLLRMRSHFVVGAAHHTLGNYRRGVRACEASLGLLDEELARERFGMFPVYARTWLTLCLAHLGDFARALVVAHEAADLAHANGRPEPLVASRAALGQACHIRGDFPEAIEHFESGLTLCREAGIGVWFSFLTGGLGHVYALSGRPAEAQLLLDECLAAARIQTRSAEAFWLAWLAEAHLLARRPAEALEVATHGLEVAREQHARGAEATVQHVLGEIASSAAPPDVAGARAHYDSALALAEELGMQPLIAHCHTGLARLCRTTGDARARDAHFATAAALYRGMGMAHWLERMEGPLRPGAPEPAR